MRLQVLSVYDSKMEAYLPPIFTRSKGEALRSFEQACSEQNGNFAKHSADFTLFFLGEFDDQTAIFEMQIAPIPLAHAHEVVAALRSRQPHLDVGSNADF